MKLNDTIEMMTSDDYKERFKAEYYQLGIRLNGLLSMLQKWDAGELNFVPTCSREIYTKQVQAMEDYLNILLERACVENIIFNSK